MVAGSSRREAVLLGPHSGRARPVGVPSRTELQELPGPPLSDLGRAGGELWSLCERRGHFRQCSSRLFAVELLEHRAHPRLHLVRVRVRV